MPSIESIRSSLGGTPSCNCAYKGAVESSTNWIRYEDALTHVDSSYAAGKADAIAAFHRAYDEECRAGEHPLSSSRSFFQRIARRVRDVL